MSFVVVATYIVTMIVFAIFLNLGGWWFTIFIFDRLGQHLKFPPFVAVRHMKGRKNGFLTLIGGLAIISVSFSSCTLTTVLSVMGGFSSDLKGKILETNAHVVVDVTGTDMENWKDTLEKVRKTKGVKGATPIVNGEMMMNARSNNHAIMLKGIDIKNFKKVSAVLNNLEEGDANYLTNPKKLFEKINKIRTERYGPFKDSNNKKVDAGIKEADTEKDKYAFDIPPPTSPKDRVLPVLIVGKELKKSLRLYEGCEVNIISPVGDIGPTGSIPKSRPFRIGGVFFSGMYEYDSLYVYTSIEAAQKFLRKGNRITEIQASIDNPDKADLIAKNIHGVIGNDYRVRSWMELNQALFSALNLEKIVMFIFLSIAIIVASFCIFATLTMLVLEKSSEVSTLMTLGATKQDIKALFRFEGLLIGLVGTLSGLAVGLGLCLTIDIIGLKIDPEVWYLDKLPIKISAMEFIYTGIASLIITQLAPLIPARTAAQLTPLEGLKHE